MGTVEFKENKIRNPKLEETLKQALRFNEMYIGYIEEKLKLAKQAKEEILNGTSRV